MKTAQKNIGLLKRSIIMFLFILILTAGDCSKPADDYTPWYSQDWEFTTIAHGSGFADFAIGTDNSLHFLYYFSGGNTEFDGSLYKRIKSSGEEKEWSLWSGALGPYASIILDSSNTPHIAACYNLVRLQYATISNDQLLVTTIASSAGGGNNDIAIDTNGVPYIVNEFSASLFSVVSNLVVISNNEYSFSKINISSNNIMHLSNQTVMYKVISNGNFIYDSISGGSGEHNALVLDSSNSPHIIYLNNGIQYFHKSNASWIQETIPDTGNYAHKPDITVSSNGTVHIVYFSSDEGMAGLGVQELWHAWKTGGQWYKEKLCIEKLSFKSNLRIRIDPDGKLNIVFFLDYHKSISGPLLIRAVKK